jgi:hypothetical protein
MLEKNTVYLPSVIEWVRIAFTLILKTQMLIMNSILAT